jgi:hypothetical protein
VKAIPVIDDNSFDAEQREKLRADFKDEKLVAIKVRVALPLRDGGQDEGELLVFLQRQTGTDRFESYFVREGMTITKLNSKRSLRGVKAWVSVESGPLASLLGDTEGPAHTSWDTSNDERPNRTWKTWKGRVTFCTRIVDSLAEFLSPPTDEADFDLLSEFFSIENASSTPKPRRKPGDKGESTKGFDPPDPTPRWFRSAPKAGGFRVTSSPALPTPPNAVLRMSVAYDMSGGNPLKHWSPFDFDFRKKAKGEINFTGKNVKAEAKEGNVLEIYVDGEEFELTVQGFDVNRDLVVRIDDVTSKTEDAE